MMKDKSLIFIGFGPLGQQTLQQAAENGYDIAGVVDVHPDLENRSVGELCKLPSLTSMRIVNDLKKLDCTHAVAIVTTVSRISKLKSQLQACFAAGVSVVSSCEELVFPWLRQPEQAREIDQAAKAAGVAVVATGVNPGFLMDSLPTFLASVCQRCDHILVERFQNASKRRLPFRQKIGAGLDLKEFDKQQAAGTLSHVGLEESAQMLAAGLAWKLDTKPLLNSLKPIIARKSIELHDMKVETGQAAGVEQVFVASVAAQERIRLHFRASLDETKNHDRIKISGKPSLDSSIDNGLDGDIATCSLLLNVAKRLAHAQAGLHTMLDLPLHNQISFKQFVQTE